MTRAFRVVAFAVGLLAAFGGLAVDLLALPMARFGSSLLAYADSRNSSVLPFLLAALVLCGLAAAVALAATLKSRAPSFRGGPLFWVLLGFGPPAVASSSVAAVIGFLTYSTGVVPDGEAEWPWQLVSRGVSYAGAIAVVICVVVAVAERIASRRKTPSHLHDSRPIRRAVS